MQKRTDKRTEPCFNHSTKNDKISISPASHFLKFLCQPAFTHSFIDLNGVRESLRLFGTFAKPLEPTHNPSFAKEPNHPHSQDYYTLYQFSQVEADFFTTIGNLFKLLFVSLLSG